MLLLMTADIANVRKQPCYLSDAVCHSICSCFAVINILTEHSGVFLTVIHVHTETNFVQVKLPAQLK